MQRLTNLITNTMDDMFLLQLIKNGDKQAFKYVFDTYFTVLCRFMYLYLGDTQEAEDIASDIFASVWELNNLIQEAILSLPEKCREVFLQSRTKNLTNQEIAESMDISVKTVEAQITKALKQIRKFLGTQYQYLF